MLSTFLACALVTKHPLYCHLINDTTISHLALITPRHDYDLILTHLEGGPLDLVRVLVKVHVSQHHHAGQQQRGGVGQVLAGDVGGSAVHRLEYRAVSADVAAGREAKTADKAGTQVREDVTIQVGHHQDVVLTGVLHHVEAHCVQVPLLELDAGVSLSGLSTALQEQTVTHPHNVSFVNRCDLERMKIL